MRKKIAVLTAALMLAGCSKIEDVPVSAELPGVETTTTVSETEPTTVTTTETLPPEPEYAEISRVS